MIQQKNSALKAWKKDRSNVNLDNTYKNLKCQVRRSIHYFKSKHYNKKIHSNKGNSKIIWKTIKELFPNNKSSNLPVARSNKESTMQTASLFNVFFANVGNNTVKKTQLSDSSRLPATNPVDITDPNCLFRPEPIDWQTLVLTIAHMKNSDACGSDEITLRFLNDSLPVIVSYLTTIMNTSIVTGIFPTAWIF